jgi:iron complex outermembrane receptor protein
LKPIRFKAIYYFLFFGLNLGSFSLVQAQHEHELHIKIVDSLTQEPLAYASVSLDKQKQLWLSNEQGIVVLPKLLAGSYVLHVSFVGYHHSDLLLRIPQQLSYTIELCSETFHLHEGLVQAEANKAVFSGRKQDQMLSAEIDKRRGQNLAELLKNINGVKAMNSAGGIAKPAIRGLSGQRIVTMQGNSRIEGQQWGEDHGPELDPFIAHSVSVIKGAAAVEFGPEAMGGVIQVEPKPWRSEKGMEGALYLQGLSNNRQGAASLRLESVYGKKIQYGWRMQASARKAGDARTPNYVLSNTGFTENAGMFQSFVGSKKWKWENTLSIYQTKQAILQAAHLGNTSDLNRALAANRPLIVLPFTYQINRPFQQVKHVLFLSELSYQINASTKLRLSYSQQVNDRQEFDADRVYNQALQGRAALDLEILSRQLEQVMEKKWGGHWMLKAGLNQSFQENITAGLQWIIPTFNSVNLAAFSMLKYYNESSSLSIGLRYDYRKLNVPEFRRFGKNYAYARDFNGLNAGITYIKLTQHKWQHTLSLQSAWRPPALNELYSYGLHYGLASFEIGDSNLVPERAWMLEWDVKKSFKKWQVEGSFYAQVFENYIYKRPLSAPILTIRGAFPALMFTQTSALIAGVDAVLRYKPAIGWQWESRFSQIYGQDLRLQEALFLMPANSMEHSLAYAFKSYKKMAEPYAELRSLWVARQYRFAPNLDFREPPAAYALFQLNMGFSYLVNPKWRAWNIHVTINNLLNTNYRDYLSRFRYFTDEPGVNFILRLHIPI